MEPDEVVLSDIHIYSENLGIEDAGTSKSNKPCGVPAGYISRFTFWWDKGVDSSEASGFGIDEDGDIVVKRRNSIKQNEVISLEHSMATTLNHVGLQVWAGSLILADYIMENPDCFTNKNVIELGAGTGLCGIVTSLFAENIICTDNDLDALCLCKRNFERNKHLWKYCATGGEKTQVCLVKHLDFNNFDYQNLNQDNGDYNWKKRDITLLNSCSVLLASEVIYDNSLTDSFFKVVTQIMSQSPPKQLYISLERRLNFTLADLDVVCPAYDHFISWLENIKEINEVKFTVYQLATDFTQRFKYKRTQYLELWLIESSIRLG